MSYKSSRKADAVFKKAQRQLKPWEKTAQETARKTERLRNLRLAKEAADREAADAASDTGSGSDRPAAKTQLDD